MVGSAQSMLPGSDASPHGYEPLLNGLRTLFAFGAAGGSACSGHLLYQIGMSLVSLIVPADNGGSATFPEYTISVLSAF